MPFFPALILALLLCGCAGQETEMPTIPQEPYVSKFTGYYAPSDLEVQTGGAVRAYPLDLPDASSIHPLGEDLLVLSRDNATQLTILTGDNLIPTASRQLTFTLSPENLQISCDEIIYYDPVAGEMVILDRLLNPVSAVPVPGDLVGIPYLSADRSTLYYCTANSVRAWDLRTNIHRCVKDLAYDTQSVTGIHMADSIIECTVQDNGQVRKLFLSADIGSLCHFRNGNMALETVDDRFYTVMPSGAVQSVAFGAGEIRTLIPRDLFADITLFPNCDAAVSVYQPADNRLRLEYYCLTDGKRLSSLEWDTVCTPNSLAASGNKVFFLICDSDSGKNIIYRWEPYKLPLNDNRCYTDSYYSRENPDEEGLQRCQAYAAGIGRQYGIEIIIGKEAAAIQPWDYDLEAEYLVPVFQEELRLLEQRLSYFPEKMLSDTASHFSRLNICIVRSITGSAESGSLDNANGIQFFDGTDAYVVISPGKLSGQALYHELFHAMETHLLNQNTALDRWEELNPTGFRYDYNYLTNKSRDAGIYLRKGSRAFVDTYSMSFPKEDKARVMEYAMLPGQNDLFQSPTMRAKLQCLSDGLRKAYGLTAEKNAYLWEQYLK